jgi:hypothetical protein
MRVLRSSRVGFVIALPDLRGGLIAHSHQDALARFSGLVADTSSWLLDGVRSRGWHEVKLPLPFLVKHAIASGATTAYVHPVGWHHHD